MQVQSTQVSKILRAVSCPSKPYIKTVMTCEAVVGAYHPKTTSQEQKGSGMPIAIEGLDCI